MSSSTSSQIRAFVACAIVGVLGAGCGGGVGSSPSPVLRSTAAPVTGGNGAGTGTATFVITWPAGSSAASTVRSTRPRAARHRNYLSASTASIAIIVNSGSPIVVNNPNIASSGASPSPTTTQTVIAPLGTDTFTVNDYDKMGGTGNLLATNSVSFTIVQDSANVIPLTLNGNLEKVACNAVAPYVTGTAPTFSLVGPTGQLSILPEDADGNIIVAPGTIPPVTLSAANPSMATVTSTATTNLYDVHPLVVGTAVTFDASGTDDNGNPVTTTCNVTRALAMYITNHYLSNPGQSSSGAAANPGASVTIYPASATGSATPTATIAGSNTMLSQVQFVAVDTMGNVFVTNTGPQPGATFGPDSGYVSIYGPAANGNVAPIATIPNLNTPEGIAFDTNGKLYVLAIDHIAEYPPTSNGVTAPAVPTTVIAGSNFDDGCYGLAVDTAFNIYAACPYEMEAFAAGSSGNADPAALEAVGMTAATYQSDSWIGVAVDTSNNILLPASNNNLDDVSIYPTSDVPSPGAAATPVPTLSKSTGYSQPYGITFDSTGKYYVVNYGSNSLETFTSLTMLEAGVGTNSTLTGLNEPIGIAVR